MDGLELRGFGWTGSSSCKERGREKGDSSVGWLVYIYLLLLSRLILFI